MRMPWTSRFDQEAELCHLRWTCVDCVHYVPEIRACAHEWPNGDHFRAPGTVDEARPDERDLVFCKEFELR